LKKSVGGTQVGQIVLKASVHNNTIAHGFSIMITAALVVFKPGETQLVSWRY
jgi:hypothetical protein